MANFEKVVTVVLANEGGYMNDPSDAGGETKYGISKRSYPDVDIKNLTIAQAKAIYLKDFWAPFCYEQIKSDAMATKLFDTSVNVGQKRAFRFMQQALNQMGQKLLVDGDIGPKTIASINSVDNSVLLNVYRSVQAEYYKGLVAAKPANAKFLRGWLIRAQE